MQRFTLALRATGSVLMMESNILPLYAAVLWFAAKDAAFRAGFSFAAGLSEPTTAALWRMTAIMLLFPVLWVFGSVFFQKEVDEEAVRFFMRHHIGRVYFVYPYRLVRYIVSRLFLLTPTPR